MSIWWCVSGRLCVMDGKKAAANMWDGNKHCYTAITYTHPTINTTTTYTVQEATSHCSLCLTGKMIIPALLFSLFTTYRPMGEIQLCTEFILQSCAPIISEENLSVHCDRGLEHGFKHKVTQNVNTISTSEYRFLPWLWCFWLVHLNLWGEAGEGSYSALVTV